MGGLLRAVGSPLRPRRRSGSHPLGRLASQPGSERTESYDVRMEIRTDGPSRPRGDRLRDGRRGAPRHLPEDRGAGRQGAPPGSRLSIAQHHRAHLAGQLTESVSGAVSSGSGFRRRGGADGEEAAVARWRMVTAVTGSPGTWWPWPARGPRCARPPRSPRPRPARACPGRSGLGWSGPPGGSGPTPPGSRSR
jgi:hypothetical protein